MILLLQVTQLVNSPLSFGLLHNPFHFTLTGTDSSHKHLPMGSRMNPQKGAFYQCAVLLGRAFLLNFRIPDRSSGCCLGTRLCCVLLVMSLQQLGRCLSCSRKCQPPDCCCFRSGMLVVCHPPSQLSRRRSWCSAPAGRISERWTMQQLWPAHAPGPTMHPDICQQCMQPTSATIDAMAACPQLINPD